MALGYTTLTYTVCMHHLLYRLAMGLAACCCVGSLIAAVLDFRLAISTRKGRLRLVSRILLGAGLCIGGLSFVTYQHSLPVYHADGIIRHAQEYTSGKSRRTRLHVLTGTDSELVLDASGISPYFRQGEHLIVTYKGVTGTVMKATFLKADGSVMGVFNGTDSWPAYFTVVGGMLMLYWGIKVYRRDPEGAEQRPTRNQKPLTGVDEASLMRLSSVSPKDDER
jgi:hypothetical protein